MKQAFLSGFFVVFSAILLSSFTFHQSPNLHQGLTIHFDSAHDAYWHLALMESLNQSVPPANPLITGEKLVGYHYLNDLFWVGIHRVTGLSLIVLYLKIAPIILAAFFATSTLVLFLKIFTHRTTAYLGATIAILGANFAYLVPVFFPKSLAHQSVFWLDQTVHLGINQQLLLSLSLVNLIYICWWMSPKKYWLIIGSLIGVLVSIKVYATMIMLPLLLLLAGKEFFHKRELTLMKASFVSLIIAIPLLLFTGNKNGFPFFWEPGWFLKTMWESGDRLNFPRWEMMRVNAVTEGDWPRLIVLWGVAAVIFYLGNFGIKILGVIALPLMFLQPKIRANSFWWFLGLIVISSLTLPSILLQKGVAWNTIQFLHYASVPLTIFLVRLIEQRVRQHSWRLSLLISALVISVPTTFLTVITNLELQPKTYIHYSGEFVDSITSLRNSYVDKELIIGSTLYHYSIVPALTGRSVYWADEVILTILGNQHLERKEFIRQLELGEANCQSHQVLVELYQGKVIQYECPLVIPPPPEVVPHLYQIEQ